MMNERILSMFGVKKEAVKEENNGINTYELQVENEKLKIKAETLQFKLDQANEKYFIIEKQLKEIKGTDIERTKEENISLKKELTDLKFKMANDTKSIELETENKKLKSQIDVQQSENEHLTKLLDTYRAMPDVRNMIDNMSSLAVPHIDELKEFAKMISDSKVAQLCDELSKTNVAMRETQDHLNYMYRRDIFRQDQ